MPDDVIKALGGTKYNGAGGLYTIDGQTNHTIMDIHIGVGNRSGSFDVVKSFSQQQPSDTQAVCDLIKNPNDTKQYEPGCRFARRSADPRRSPSAKQRRGFRANPCAAAHDSGFLRKPTRGTECSFLVGTDRARILRVITVLLSSELAKLELVATTVYLVIYSIALLVLISLGLAVIFGMMKVINLAHGEFMMLGAYGCVFAGNAGAPLWAATVLSAVLVGAFGVLVERLIIRFLYGRIIDTLLATWGLSLFLVGGVTTVFGPQGRSLSTSFGNVSFGGVNLSVYNLILIGVTAAVAWLTWALARFTKVGLIVRGTMQEPDIASALGANRSLTYMATFGYGAALAGFAGAVLAPITGASPTMGVFFVAKAFITVIVGGHLPLMGTLAASGLFGMIDGIVSYRWSSVLGEVSVLVVAVVLLRMLPSGITGRFRSGL